MNLQDCIRFSYENPICFIATMDKDQPRVRGLAFWFADETGFYFQTSSIKEFPHQLKKNPKAEICFYKHYGMIGTMLRITGKVEFVNDIKLKEKVLLDRPFLKTYGITLDNSKLILFRISHGQAHFWTLDNNFKPKEYIEF